MPYQILYHPSVLTEDLVCLPPNIKKRIKRAIETRLVRDPISTGRPLRQSLLGHRKIRVGDYRIIYRIEGNSIIILKIEHRKDVYEKALLRA